MINDRNECIVYERKREVLAWWWWLSFRVFSLQYAWIRRRSTAGGQRWHFTIIFLLHMWTTTMMLLMMMISIIHTGRIFFNDTHIYISIFWVSHNSCNSNICAKFRLRDSWLPYVCLITSFINLSISFFLFQKDSLRISGDSQKWEWIFDRKI